MEPLKLGVIGCGVIGAINLKDAMASALVKVVAAADLRGERREWAKAQGVPRVYEDGSELIDQDPEVEAVIIAYPVSTRTAMALRAFARGKHVLTEKPVANNAREVRTLMARRGDRVCACFSSRYRFYDSARRVEAVLANGSLGEIRRLHVRALQAGTPQNDRPPPPWRESFCMNAGGILTNWSCYDLDYILGLTGWAFRPRTVLAQIWSCVPTFRCHIAPESDAEAHFAALVTGADGSVLTIERGEFMPMASEAAWQIIGTQGALRLGMVGSAERRLILDTASAAQGVTSQVLWEGNDSGRGGGALVIEDFALAVRQQRPPATGLEQALVMMQITDAIYESARTGGAVTLP
jgi:predicted dehydrogenase